MKSEKGFSYSKCPEEWEIQAYIDSELDEQNSTAIANHLHICQDCNARTEARKVKSKQILDLMELADKQPLPEKISLVNSKANKKFVYLLAWVSVAASVIVIVSIFALLYSPNSNNSLALEQNCQWVEVDGSGFHADFISPNRLYQMRVIEITRVSDDGQLSKTTLAKECNTNK